MYTFFYKRCFNDYLTSKDSKEKKEYDCLIHVHYIAAQLVTLSHVIVVQMRKKYVVDLY